MTLQNNRTKFVATLADLTVTQLCFVAPKFLAGTAAVGSVITNINKINVSSLFGVGSLAYKVSKQVMDTSNNNQSLSILTYNDGVSDEAATATQLLNGTSSKAGRIYLTIGDVDFQRDFASGTTAQAVFVALKALIDVNANCLAICGTIAGTLPDGTMPLTSKHKGVISNDIVIKFAITDTTGNMDNCGFTRSEPVPFTGGTGQPNLTTAFAALENFTGDIVAFAEWFKQPSDLETILDEIYANFGVKNGYNKAKRLYLLTNDLAYWEEQFLTNTVLQNHEATPLLGFISFGHKITSSLYSTDTDAFSTHPYLNGSDVIMTYAFTKNQAVNIAPIFRESIQRVGNVRNSVIDQSGLQIVSHYKPKQLFKDALAEYVVTGDQVSELIDGNITVAGSNQTGENVFLTPMLTSASTTKYPLLRFAGGVDVARYFTTEAFIGINKLSKNFGVNKLILEIKGIYGDLIEKYNRTEVVGNTQYDALLDPRKKSVSLANLIVFVTQNPGTNAPTQILSSASITPNFPITRIDSTVLLENETTLTTL